MNPFLYNLVLISGLPLNLEFDNLGEKKLEKPGILNKNLEKHGFFKNFNMFSSKISV